MDLFHPRNPPTALLWAARAAQLPLSSAAKIQPKAAPLSGKDHVSNSDKGNSSCKAWVRLTLLVL